MVPIVYAPLVTGVLVRCRHGRSQPQSWPGVFYWLGASRKRPVAAERGSEGQEPFSLTAATNFRPAVRGRSVVVKITERYAPDRGHVPGGGGGRPHRRRRHHPVRWPDTRARATSSRSRPRRSPSRAQQPPWSIAGWCWCSGASRCGCAGRGDGGDRGRAGCWRSGWREIRNFTAEAQRRRERQSESKTDFLRASAPPRDILCVARMEPFDVAQDRLRGSGNSITTDLLPAHAAQFAALIAPYEPPYMDRTSARM